MCLFRCEPWVPGANAAQEEATTPTAARRCTVCSVYALEPTATTAMNDPPRRGGNRGLSRQLRWRAMRMPYQRVELGLARHFGGEERDLHAQQGSKA